MLWNLDNVIRVWQNPKYEVRNAKQTRNTNYSKGRMGGFSDPPLKKRSRGIPSVMINVIYD
ncbi:MAG: hypothetical protein SVY53_00545 [Chloroflexota bacterium]|nr:hypothetical protein [Chloroflexota bacterium]